MNFDYTDDQKALKDQARRFLTDNAPISAARAVLENPAAGFDAKLWAKVGAQGWCGAAIPENYGGLGLGYVELCALAEELGRSLAPIPFASSVYQFAEALLVAGSEAQKEKLLPQIASGELIGAVAFSEQAGQPAQGRIGASFRGGVLSGLKLPVIDGMAAHYAVVLAQGEIGLDLCLVNLTASGVERSVVSTLDPTRGAAQIRFNNVAAERLGAAGEGESLMKRIAERSAVLLAFEQLGGADRCLELARDYALERFAFGRPIGSYQAIKHKLADVYVKNAVARANAYYGAWALSTGAPELPVAAASARIAASAAYWQASKEMIQTFGGIGFTWEADCHLFYRRARHLGLILGAPRIWKRRLVDQLEQNLTAEAGGKAK